MVIPTTLRVISNTRKMKMEPNTVSSLLGRNMRSCQLSKSLM